MLKRGLQIVMALVLIGSTISCDSGSTQKLPVLGLTDYKEVNGKLDTVYHTIPDFSFTDQDSLNVTPATFEGKIYVADFFFGTCPTICPIMKQQMLRVYEEFKDNPNFGILSHTIDPAHDTVAYLKDFSMRLGIPDSKVWKFVTGDQDEIYEIGSEKGYLVPVGEDADAPGGFIHSGAFILVDQERRIRGIYDGTKPIEVSALINDIPRLLAEYE
ncbi:SCO family protein [Roseivirga misakiensis]|uniref:Electron transporter n=1 Tax=Roseivirga misakiensis TaxID=1563681 RepID=A0A1E5T5F4_9BACT|nr:SCO family protein [Roseivirga misakiensis]OEK06537.1 electron transporter [Roseivirga misakiensis]